jgi:hypothetical protein
VSPRPSPIANHVLKEIVIMFYRLVSQVFYKLVAYVFVRTRSLRVGGQGPNFVPKCMEHINKILTPPWANRPR